MSSSIDSEVVAIAKRRSRININKRRIARRRSVRRWQTFLNYVIAKITQP